MKTILICVILVQIGLSQAYPGSNTQGVGAFAYQDSTGNRYGGTYGLKDGQVVNAKGNFPPSFNPNTFTPNFFDFDDFFPDYFRNLENLLQEFRRHAWFGGLRRSLRSRLSRFPSFDGFPHFGGLGGMHSFGGPNSAFAGTVAGPGFDHQMASINPANPGMPNVNVFKQVSPRGGGSNRVGVSSSSYSSSSNINGQQYNTRGSETMVDRDGIITKYSVHS